MGGLQSPQNRLDSGGSSVVVDGAGNLTITAGTGSVSITTTGLFSLTSANFGVNGGTLTVRGTAFGNGAGFVVNPTFAAGSSCQVHTWQRSGVTKHSLILEGTSDDLFFQAIGGTTEALRIQQATAYVQVPLRLGIGVSPGFPLQISASVSGFSIVTSAAINASPSTGTYSILGNPNGTGVSAGYFQQSAASATVPVVTIMMGATPGAAADALQINNSTPTVIARVRADGLGDFTVKGLATIVKAGTPTDGDWAFGAPPTGTIIVDTTGNKIWARTGVATYKGVVIA